MALAKKPMYEGGRADKNLKLFVRILIGIIIFVVALHMTVIRPAPTSWVNTEYMWQALHPYNWFFDTLGIIAFIFLCLYVSGLAGKTIYYFTEQKSENSSGLVHLIFTGSVVLMILMYIL